MKQAFYVISDRQADFVGGVPFEFAKDSAGIRANLAYELPAEYTGSHADGPVRYCLMARDVGRILSRTVPTAGSRRNLSFTHLLFMTKVFPFLEYLHGWDDWFWRESPVSTEFPERLALNKLPWQKPDQSRLLSVEWMTWLADPQHQKLQRFTLIAHLSLPKGGRIFLPAKPLDVFRAVYGLARLLPDKLTANVTFSTYEHAPGGKNLRVIGTDSTPTGTRLEKDWVFAGQADMSSATSEATAFANRVLDAQNQQPERLAKFLGFAKELDSIGRLLTFINGMLDGLDNAATNELLQLADDSIGQAMIFDSPAAVERILTEGSATRVAWFVASIPSSLKEEIRIRLFDRVNQAVQVDDVGLVRSLLGSLKSLEPGRSNSKATGIVTPCRSVEMFRTLTEWAPVDGLKASLFDVTPNLEEQFLRGGGDLDHTLRAGWALRRLVAVSPDQLALFVTTGGSTWQLVRDHLLKSDPTQLSGIASRLLSVSFLSTSQALKSEILHVVTALDKQPSNSASICDLLIAMYDARVVTAVDLVQRFSNLRSKPATWPTRLRGRLALSLLSDSAENAIQQQSSREALFALNASECDLGDRTLRLTALRRLSDWLGKDTINERGEDITSALDTLVEWRNATPTAKLHVVPFGVEVLARVFRLRNLVPPKWTLTNWFAALRPVWQRASGDFTADWFEAAMNAPTSTRTAVYLAAVDVADEVNDGALRRQVLGEVMVLPSEARDSLVMKVSERNWFLREVRQPSTWWVCHPILSALLLVVVGITLGIAALFLLHLVP